MRARSPAREMDPGAHDARLGLLNMTMPSVAVREEVIGYLERLVPVSMLEHCTGDVRARSGHGPCHRGARQLAATEGAA